MSWPSIGDAPAGHVVEAEQEARERATCPTPDGPTTATVLPGGNREAHVEQDLPVRLVAEVDVLEAHLAVGDDERRRARARRRPRVCSVDEREHPLHVGQRLLDLAVEDAEEVERDVELDHERVDQHEVADRHRARRRRRPSRAT